MSVPQFSLEFPRHFLDTQRAGDNATYRRIKAVQVPYPGTVFVSFDMTKSVDACPGCPFYSSAVIGSSVQPPGDTYPSAWAAVGIFGIWTTYTGTITVAAGDVIYVRPQSFSSINSTGDDVLIRNFRVYYEIVDLDPQALYARD